MDRMKFHWFAEQTYNDLPEKDPNADPDRFLSNKRLDSLKIGEHYKMFIRLMRQADELGWDGLAVNEHHQTAFAMTPSPNLVAADLAHSTNNAAILIIGDSLALYNPPIRIAEEMAYIDCLSEGRLIAGFVYGTPADSLVAYGTPPIELRERFDEARQLIEKAWKEPDPFAWDGKYHQLRYVNTLPRPVQEKPPVWVPGLGSIETWDLVIDNDYCYGYLSFFGLDNCAPIIEGYWEHVEARGGDMNPYRMALTQLICVADTDEEAEAKYYEAVKYFYSRQSGPLHFAAPPGAQTIPSMRAGLNRVRPLTAEDRMRGMRGELSFWEYDELGFIVAGTPERVRQRLEELGRQLRVGQLITCMHMGNLSEETARENNHLFGTKVAPHLKDMWSDWEDRWTPKVSQERVKANAPKVPASA
jgi:alkanesulfonate monooxygenase SsuD/methylene tetrahydromethanopterin reductase-like flavin-dependent oxidoreductase (luciferase family)